MGLEKAAEDGGNVAGGGAQAGALRAETKVEVGVGLGAGEEVFDERAAFLKTLGVRMTVVEPVREHPRAHVGETPHHAAVNEARDVVGVGVGAPRIVRFGWLIHRGSS